MIFLESVRASINASRGDVMLGNAASDFPAMSEAPASPIRSLPLERAANGADRDQKAHRYDHEDDWSWGGTWRHAPQVSGADSWGSDEAHFGRWWQGFWRSMESATQRAAEMSFFGNVASDTPAMSDAPASPIPSFPLESAATGLIEISKLIDMIMKMIGPGVGRGGMLHNLQKQIRGKAMKLILEDIGKAIGRWQPDLHWSQTTGKPVRSMESVAQQQHRCRNSVRLCFLLCNVNSIIMTVTINTLYFPFVDLYTPARSASRFFQVYFARLCWRIKA